MDFVTPAGLKEGFIRNLVELMVFMGIADGVRQSFSRLSQCQSFLSFFGKNIECFVSRDLRWIHGDRILIDDLLLLLSESFRRTHSHEIIQQRILNKK